jgi:hypothetical protein
VSRRASRSTWKAVPGICTAGIWLLCKRRRCKYPATLLCTGSGGMTDRSTSTHIAQRVRSVYSSDQSRMNWISTEIGQSGRPKRTLWLAPRSPPSRPLPRRHHPGDIAITQHSCTRHSFPVPCRAVLCCAVYMCLLPPSHQAEHHRAFFLFIFPSRGTPRASGPYTRYCSYVHAILGTLASEGRDDGNTKNHSRTAVEILLCLRVSLRPAYPEATLLCTAPTLETPRTIPPHRHAKYSSKNRASSHSLSLHQSLNFDLSPTRSL